MARRSGLWVEIGVNLALLTVLVSVLDAGVFYVVTQQVVSETASGLAERTANPVATKVTLLLLAEGAERTVEHLVRERAVRVARMRELTAARQRPGTTFQEVLAADHALAHLDADLRWIESARRRIHDLEGEIA